MGLVYIHKNEKDGRVYIGETIWSGHIRHAEHLDPFNYQSRELFSDMITLGLNNFTYDVLEDNIDTKSELLRLEAKWIAFYKAKDPRYGYNGGWTGKMWGCPITAATFPIVSTQTKPYDPFFVNESHIGQRVLYRWQKKDDSEQLERLGTNPRCHLADRAPVGVAS